MKVIIVLKQLARAIIVFTQSARLIIVFTKPTITIIVFKQPAGVFIVFLDTSYNPYDTRGGGGGYHNLNICNIIEY